MMLKWLIAPVVVYGAFVALVYVAQRLLQYFPERRRTAPSAIGLANAEEVVLDTADGERVIVWLRATDSPSLSISMATAVRYAGGRSAFAILLTMAAVLWR
jgi:hypothetical protein